MWIAYSGEYSDRRAVGVYSTRDRAIEAWVQACFALNHDPDEAEEPDVTECELDAAPERL